MSSAIQPPRWSAVSGSVSPPRLSTPTIARSSLAAVALEGILASPRFVFRFEERPTLARDFIPATIDNAAMPVRVEQWIVDSRPEYRITGIIWGGAKPTNALSIRFRSGQAWTRVDHCPLPASTLTWSLWSHTWRPTEPGRYQIVLRVDDPAIRTRRLDIFFYVREVQIEDV